jgi:hypothetical protein
LATASPAKVRRPRSGQVPSRYDAFITGELSVEDLDMEELLKGQIRDTNGTFKGRPPKAIPREFHVKVTQELLQRAEANWREHMEDAMAVFVDIMKDPKKPAQFRLQAAQYVFERIAGKIPDKQVVEATVRKWEDVADAVIVEVVADTGWEDPRTAVEPAPAPRRPSRKKVS